MSLTGMNCLFPLQQQPCLQAAFQLTLAFPLNVFPQLRLQSWSGLGWEHEKYVVAGNVCVGLGLGSLWGTIKPRESNACV